jgi:membrane protein
MATTTSTSPSQTENVPGESAEKPTEVPAKGWLQIAKRGWAEAKADNVPLLAAGVAFYTFLAIFPAMVALVLLYGLIADPATISAQVDGLGAAVPGAAKELIESNLTTLSSRPAASGVSLAIAVLLALWSASGGMGNMMTAISLAYDEEEKRSFIKKRLIALALTLGAIVFMVVALGLIAVAPGLLHVATTGVLKWVLQVVRWIVIAALVTVALAVLYRVAPDRDAPKVRWVSVGAGVATLLWLVASAGFSIYAGYGALAGIVVLLFWLWITAYAILLGAEINAESEQQTVADTTKGPAEPLGQRNAVKADSVPTDVAPENADSEAGGNKNSHSTTSTNHQEKHMSEAVPPSPASHGAVSVSSSLSSGASSTSVPAGSAGAPDASIGDLVKNVSEDLSRLVRDEIRLAQTEVTEKAKHAGVGIGAFGGAGVVAIFGLAILLAAAVLGLATVLPAWLAALIVGVVVFIVAGAAALFGKKQLSQAAPPTPTRAIASVKEDVTEIKETIKR